MELPSRPNSTGSSRVRAGEDIAFDAVAFEPGDWDFVPGMIIPKADLDAPDSEFEDTDRRKQPHPDGVIGLAAVNFEKQVEHRRAPLESTRKPQVSVCLGRLRTATRPPAASKERHDLPGRRLR
ncbi:hypothetical protein [Streptomyces sp. bgisy022]|uniref:hypothetical protein n=1 Tax=Streptomyces sp. bgisy022 TaxID=3413769 RepID=UPI003D70BD19